MDSRGGIRCVGGSAHSRRAIVVVEEHRRRTRIEEWEFYDGLSLLLHGFFVGVEDKMERFRRGLLLNRCLSFVGVENAESSEIQWRSYMLVTWISPKRL